MRIAIIGYGVVGSHIAEDVKRAGHSVVMVDPALQCQHELNEARVAANYSDAAFVCVPTPMAEGGGCDLSAIDDVFGWLEAPVVIIRSTVLPGTTAKLQRSNESRRIAFVPEFIGEGVNAPYREMRQPPFLIIGGDREARGAAGDILSHIYNSECEFVYTDATTAEVAKYAENYFLALKVSWANELYDICGRVGTDFQEMMGAVTHDYRIGRSHTHVYPNERGWGGRCLPKDLAALLALVGPETAPLLTSLIDVNAKLRGTR